MQTFHYRVFRVNSDRKKEEESKYQDTSVSNPLLAQLYVSISKAKFTTLLLLMRGILIYS
jgi:hypothetical protein